MSGPTRSCATIARKQGVMTSLKMYRKLASWWPLLSPPSEYSAEAQMLILALRDSMPLPVRSVLELGSGGGSNALYLKQEFMMTLSDISEQMLEQSRALNPECEHIVGDMRTLRLGRVFDAVLIHDAIDYMISREDLAAALATAAAHLEPGGLLVIVPDETAESFQPESDMGGNDGADGRAIRYMRWTHLAEAETVRATYVYVMRDADGHTTVEHEDHLTSAFAEAVWMEQIKAAGFAAHVRNEAEWGIDTGATRRIFLATKLEA